MSVSCIARSIAILLVFACIAGAAAADVIHLRSGGRLEGEIIKEDGAAVEIRTKFGVQRIVRADIDRIERGETPSDRILKQANALPDDDADGRYRLAMEAKEAGLRKLYLEILELVIAIDAQHEQANHEFGRVKYRGRYVTPEERDRLEQAARREEMLARGLIEYKGRFVTEEEKAKLEQGLVFRGGEWIDQDEAKRRDGFVRVGSKWMRGEDYVADKMRRDVAGLLERTLNLVTTEHIAVYTDIEGDFAAKLAELLEKGYKNFSKEFGTGQELDWLGERRIDVFAFRIRFTYEKFVDFIAREKGLGERWAILARQVVSVYRFQPHGLMATYMANKGEAFTAAHCAKALGHILINRYRVDEGKYLPPFFDEAFGSLMEFDLLGMNVVFSRGIGKYAQSSKDEESLFFEDGKWTESLRITIRRLADTPLDQAIRRDHGDLLQSDIAKGMVLFMRWRTMGEKRVKKFFDLLRDKMPEGKQSPTSHLVLAALADTFRELEQKDIPQVDKELRAFVMKKKK